MTHSESGPWLPDSVPYSNLLSVMHGFRDSEVLLQGEYHVIVISLLGVLQANFHDWFWWSGHHFLIAFHSNFSSGMHSFRDNEVLLQGGYYIIVISPLGSASWDFSWWIMKSDYDFLITFYNNFLYGMNGFRDNEVLLQGGYDVIVISPLRGASSEFSCRILKERRWLPDSVP